MESRRFEFLWRIDNFSMLPHRQEEAVHSSTFKVWFLDDTKWQLMVKPRGCIDFEDYLSCYLLRLDDDSSTKIKVGYTVTIKSVHSQFNVIENEEGYEFSPGDSWGWNGFKLLKELYDSENGYLPQDVLTLECQMWFVGNEPEPVNEISEVNPVFREKCAIVSRIKVDKRCVTWPIPKIKEIVKYKSTHCIHVESALEEAPAFQVLFQFSEDADCEYAEIEITQTKLFSEIISHFVKCKITIVTTHKGYQHSKEDTFLFTSDNEEEIWSFPDFIKIENLSDDRYVNPDNILYLLCEFSFTTSGNKVTRAEVPTHSQDVFQNTMTPLAHSNHLTNTIQKLYLSRKLCDVNLQVGSQSFPAQKFIICAQSPVFYAMFENDTKEKNTNVVDIIDVEPDTLKLLPDFLHSNIMKEGLAFEEIFKLFSAADKYQIALLKQECAVLLSLMSTENVSEILVAADRHNDDFLLTHVHNFLKMYAVEVFHSSQWKECRNEDPELFGRVMILVLQDS